MITGKVIILPRGVDPTLEQAHQIANHYGARHLYNPLDDVADIVETMTTIAMPVIFTHAAYQRVRRVVPADKIVSFGVALERAEALVAIDAGDAEIPAAIDVDHPDAEPFFLVWNPRGHRSPTVRHASEMAALSEASRLAGQYQGAEFFVLEARTRCINPGLTIEQMVRPDELPF